MVDGVAGVAPAAVAVGEVIDAGVFVEEWAFGEFRRVGGWDFAAEADEGGIEDEYAEFGSCAAAGEEQVAVVFFIVKDEGVDGFEAVSSGEEGLAGVGEGAGRRGSGGDADVCGKLVALWADGVVEVVFPFVVDEAGCPCVCLLPAIFVDPGEVFEIEHRAMFGPGGEVFRFIGKEVCAGSF